MNTESDSMIPVPPTGKEIDALRHLSPEDLERARQMAQSLNATDSSAVITFAISPQKELVALTDQILKTTKTKNADAAGRAISELLQEIQALDVSSFASQAEQAFIRLPIVAPMFNQMQQFISRYESISVKIDRTVVALESARNTLSRDTVLLDNLYVQVQAQFRELLTAIAAGELKLQALSAEQAVGAKKAEEAGDPVLAQQVADLVFAISRLERRVHELKLAAMISLQTVPQIRLVQSSEQALVEKLQSSILMTIPIWKQQVIIAITLYNQKKASELSRRVDQKTKQILEDNARMIKDTAIRAEEEKQRAFVEVETLRTVNQQLIETIDETMKIQEEGRRKRREVEAELVELQKNLRKKLTGLPAGLAR